jgi:putative membrane protein
VHFAIGRAHHHRQDHDIVTQVHIALSPSAEFDSTNSIAAIVLVGIAALLWWLSAMHATVLPFWGPWDFSWSQFLAIWLIAWWYLRGLIVSRAADRPSMWRQIAFTTGMLVIYTVVQTRFEYLAEHMFFLNRLQHLAMHHLGPLLIALSWPGVIIREGMPPFLRRLAAHPVVRGCLAVVQQPVISALLFVGLIAFWLIPSVHFRAMINPDLYAVMNWSMIVDGILFWCLVLDPRAKPAARISFGARAALVVMIMFPQIMLGAMVTFTPRVLYPYYDLCGRIYSSMDARADQQLGGVIIWIPAAMMSVLGLVLVINALRRADDLRKDEDDDGSATLAIDSSAWTGL